MKKTKTIFITLLTSVLLLTPTFIKAEEEVTKTGTELITLTANIPSSYTIKFPRSVDVTSTSASFNIDIKGEISSMEKIVLTIPETVDITETVHDSNDARKVTVTISNSKDEFVLEDLTKDSYNENDARTTVSLSHDEMAAGKWNGDLSMVIAITDRYDKGTALD